MRPKFPKQYTSSNLRPILEQTGYLLPLDNGSNHVTQLLNLFILSLISNFLLNQRKPPAVFMHHIEPVRNYQPINHLPVISVNMGMIVKYQVARYLLDPKILSTVQYSSPRFRQLLPLVTSQNSSPLKRKSKWPYAY